MARERIQAVCYVDFTGDLKTTACDLELGDGLADFPGPVTLYLSSVTCPACKLVIEDKIASQFSGGEPESTSSRTARISSGVLPPPFSTLTP